MMDSVANFFTNSKKKEEQSSLILEFLMCGMEQELMVPASCQWCTMQAVRAVRCWS